MILRQLVEYADNRMELPPPMYGRTPVRWLIDLGPNGEYEGFAPQGGDTKDNKKGIERIVPQTDRTSGVKANLLVDHAEYVLGVPRPNAKPDRVKKCHKAFVELTKRCAEETQEPSVESIVAFLESWDSEEIGKLPKDFDPSLNLTFRVAGFIPAEVLTSIRSFWEAYSSGNLDSEAKEFLMTCLVTGEVGAVEETLPGNIKGIPGGQTSGTALVSANKEPFTSYGLKRATTSPISKSAGERFNKALNSLLSNKASRIYAGPLAYVFWTREKSDFGLDLMAEPDPDRVKNLLASPYSGSEQSGVKSNDFYALALSASGGRAVVRDWLETTVPEAEDHLKSWFRAQRMVSAYGEEANPLGLYALAAGAYRDPVKEMTPQVPAALVRAAIRGGRLPEDLLARAVRRNRAEGDVSRQRAALMKLVLSYTGGTELSQTMDRLNTEHPDSAYHCGRLLAELESLQVAAIRGVKATLVDRFYGSASSAPASVFGTLLRNSSAHLGKLRKERPAAEHAIQRRLEEISTRIGGEFPRSLNLRRQAVFALGYYHQRAHNRAESRQNRKDS